MWISRRNFNREKREVKVTCALQSSSKSGSKFQQMKLVEKQYQPPLHHITHVHGCKYKVEAIEGSSKSKPNNLRKNVGEETRIQKLSQ